jgi:hypothetical protein
MIKTLKDKDKTIKFAIIFPIEQFNILHNKNK